LNAVKGLTITNVVVIGMLVVIAIPAYLVYRTLNDEELLNRFFSSFREISSQNIGCTIREARHDSQYIWSVSTGFAYQGRDRYTVGVILDHAPTDEEMVSYCETLKLIADTMHTP
jgi:hypothetical protein